MAQDPNNLIWIDLEMTGLDTAHDQIIEIATVVTDANLNILADGPVFAIHQPDEVLETMDQWNQQQHGGSGLIDRVRRSRCEEVTAEAETIEFLKAFVPPGASPMCGNSICQDRRFLARVMPKLEGYFHYRNLDVSTLKELALRWAPTIADGFKKESRHLALEDIYDSINEMSFYRDYFLRLP